MGFDVNKMRRQVRKEEKFYNNTQPNILGIPLGRVRLHMRSGEILKGIITKIGKYEIIFKEEEGERDVIIYKHAIDKIEV